MTSSREFFDEYLRDRRSQELQLYTRADLGHLVRYTPQTSADGIVMFARLEPGDAKRTIREQVDYFRALGKNFEWKLYAFDEPGNLQDLLIDEGFVADKSEVFMVCSTDTLRPESAPASVQIVRIEAAQGIKDIVSVQAQVWNREFDWLTEELMVRLTQQPEQVSLYCAYIDGKPVGTGWTDFPQGSKFPELHGGAVLPELRGRGIYKALYARRLAEAASRGYKTIVVDASPMSRPILERLGFRHVCSTTPMCYKIS